MKNILLFKTNFLISYFQSILLIFANAIHRCFDLIFSKCAYIARSICFCSCDMPALIVNICHKMGPLSQYVMMIWRKRVHVCFHLDSVTLLSCYQSPYFVSR